MGKRHVPEVRGNEGHYSESSRVIHAHYVRQIVSKKDQYSGIEKDAVIKELFYPNESY